MPGIPKITALTYDTFFWNQWKVRHRKCGLPLMEKYSNLSCCPELFLEFLITEYIDPLAQNFAP